MRLPVFAFAIAFEKSIRKVIKEKALVLMEQFVKSFVNYGLKSAKLMSPYELMSSTKHKTRRGKCEKPEKKFICGDTQ